MVLKGCFLILPREHFSYVELPDILHTYIVISKKINDQIVLVPIM